MNVNNNPVRRGYLGRKNFVRQTSNVRPARKYRNGFLQSIADVKDYYLEFDDASNNMLSVLVAAFGIKMVQQFVSHLWAKRYVPTKEYITSKVESLRPLLMTWNKTTKKYELKSKEDIAEAVTIINPRTKEISKLNSKYMEHFGETAADPEFTVEYVFNPDGSFITKSYPESGNVKVKLVGSSEFGKKRSRKMRKSKKSRKMRKSIK
jgi:hypothetical protein